MSDLTSQQCQAYTSDAAPLPHQEADDYLQQLDSGWAISDNKKSIARTFKFKNYYETMAFVNLVAMVAHQQDHHPEIIVNYNTCLIEFSTHSIGGLSLNDFICAAKIDNTLSL